ncbi:hypothetical protein DFJ73DRAFT_776553 [Zopfochytrium polystomum]|nr:hypothetical protein DFJ73DRAFT_776553 [Zopfochytrium polystomum]
MSPCVSLSPATQHCRAGCLDNAIGCYSAAAVRARPDNHLLYGNRSAAHFEARRNKDALRDCIDGLAACNSSADTDVFCKTITARLVNIACLQGRPSALIADVAVALLLSPLSDAQQRLLVAAADDGPPAGSGYNPIRTGDWIALVPFLCFADSASLEAVKAVFKLWNDVIDSLPFTTILSWQTPSGADLSQLGSKQQQVEMLDGLLSTMPRSKLIKQASSLVDELREFVSWLLDSRRRLYASVCYPAKRDILQKVHTAFSLSTTSSFFLVLEYLLTHVLSRLRDHLCGASTDWHVHVF